ncbi:MAG TPA: DUF2141 domain-containing protein [Sphingomonas sp.]|nr:DUF2141 domain-containing protein [Sphingomonas sp.]
MKRALILGLLLLAGNAGPGAPVEIIVSGTRSAQGMIRVSICPEQMFLKTCPWSASAPARTGQVAIMIEGVPPGRYAVQAFHDANGDGKLGTGWFGIPNEGIGFSNDAMAHLTRPRFSKAAFDHGGTAQHIAVTVRYFLG